MNESSKSNLNPSSLDNSDGFLDPSIVPPQSTIADTSPLSEPSHQVSGHEDSSPQLENLGAGVATAVAEPPTPAPPLSKKEQKAQAKAEKKQAKLQAKTDKAQAKTDKAQAKIDAAAQKVAEKAERKAAKAAAKQAKKEKRQKSLWYRSSGLILRLLGLGIAGSLAAVGGITVASFIAAPPSEEAPLLERGLEGTSESLSATQKLPKRLVQGIANRLDPAPKPQINAAAPALTEPQRQQLITEANALRQEMAQLDQRTTALEQQLGYDYSKADLEQRLGAIAQTLTDPSAGPQASAPTQSQPEPLVMTLPTDPLFADEQSALKPGANALLGTLLSEMRTYDKATVTVTVHTDDVGSPESQRDISLRRAQVIANYLRSQTTDPDKRFTWNPVGAGNTQPLIANNSNENRQRNRRIEISVTPQ